MDNKHINEAFPMPWRYEPESDARIFSADGSTVAQVRGWGRLTGRGSGGLGFTGEDARLVQHEVGQILANGAKEFDSHQKTIAKMDDLRTENAKLQEECGQWSGSVHDMEKRLAVSQDENAKLGVLPDIVATLQTVNRELRAENERLREAFDNHEGPCTKVQAESVRLRDYAQRAHDVLADAGCECESNYNDEECLTCHGERVLTKVVEPSKED